MALPSKLKLSNLYNEGNSYLGQTGEVTLPKLGRKFENWRGGGMNGNVKVDLGLSDDSNEMTWKLGGIDKLVLQQFGAETISYIGLRFAGSYQRDDTGEDTAVEIVIRGRHEEIDFGNAKAGDDTEITVKTIWSYYKLTIDGEVVIEIDIPGIKENVGGVDRLEKHRANIGLI
ncbi:phage major tail tube protein [Acinetobacter baumannii]|uniref:phage major tail tube protein n=1 Tax=Acinetobacter baumannii TaxID=470 RepID=UPI000CE40DDA|nr:phage major tail tube protein [Acinetobacter baumannii]PPB90520.1 phage major tail tube protein [Acinetobacter baumannii]PPC11922.1 phage major tail tube protein [Acinetobacter baumannii]PPC15378.1 phage major tail tube protein [Acinetobacter baumannii]